VAATLVAVAAGMGAPTFASRTGAALLKALAGREYTHS
jgi:hypothetical protein